MFLLSCSTGHRPEISNCSYKSISLAVYTAAGETVLQQCHYAAVRGMQELHISVDAGIYFYTVQSGEEISSGKFIKL